MSITVELPNLAHVLPRYRFAYLMTTGPDGRPHAIAVSPLLQGHELLVDGGGRRTRDNAAQRPAVALVWPPLDASDYSLIVDGQATVSADQVRIRPSGAVLHRPAPLAQPAEPGACGSDCVELGLRS